MNTNATQDIPAPALEVREQRSQQQATIYRILLAVSFVHLFNDSIQALIPAMFPTLRITCCCPSPRSAGLHLPLI